MNRSTVIKYRAIANHEHFQRRSIANNTFSFLVTCICAIIRKNIMQNRYMKCVSSSSLNLKEEEKVIGKAIREARIIGDAIIQGYSFINRPHLWR